MPGERVPQAAWDIYFGTAGGSIAWPHFQRIRQAHEEALQSGGSRPGGLFGKRCSRRAPVCAEVTS
jgi:hypothetical protein